MKSLEQSENRDIIHIKDENIKDEDIEMKGLVNRPKNVVEDNFIRFYSINEKTHEDFYIDRHFNGMYVVGIAPSHPVRVKKQKIEKVSFEIARRTIETFQVSGKKKTNAFKLAKATKLCRLFTNIEKNKYYEFIPGIDGKIIEINKKIIENPNLIIENGDIEGWIAIVESFNYNRDQRKNKNHKKNKKKDPESCLLKQEQYLQYLNKHNLNNV